MPYTWMRFSTMTAPAIQGKTPREIRDFVRELVGERMLEVYFDVGEEVGYVLFKDLGGSVDTKQVSRVLGGLGTTKMLDADQADAALTSLGS